jgi:hypothetical protein
VRIPRVTQDFCDEGLLVVCAGYEPALARKHRLDHRRPRLGIRL